MNNNRIAAHESFELHELITFKNVCATKSSVMAGLVKDEELKALLNQELNTSQEHIRELQDLIQLSAFAFEDTTRTEDALRHQN